MKVFKLLLIVFLTMSILFVTYGIDIPKNNNSGKSFVYLKISGQSTNSINIGRLITKNHYVLPQSDNLDKKKAIKVSNFSFSSKTSQDCSSGDFNEWILIFEDGGSAVSQTKLYLRHQIESKVTIKENCFTILPFKIWWTLGRMKDGSDFYVNFDVQLVPLTEDDIQNIMKEIKKNKNLFTYQSIFLGDEDITDKIKEM
jgi:hypothetical protein